jgi:hypothetical protein
MFETLFGAEVPPALKFFLAFVIVLALIGLTAWLVRRFGAERFGGSSARGRQPRLAVVDAAAVDGRRRLIIIRRDNVEHLLMIGGPTDVVVEQNIVRAMGAPRDKTAEPVLGRGASIPETLTRPVPLGEGTMWPLQPQPEFSPRPQPEIGRTPRPVAEEQAQWTWPAQSEPQRPARPDNLTSLAEELSAHPAPQREPNLARTIPTPSASRTAATPPAPAPAATPAEPVNNAAGEPDQNLAEMAHRLESALRRPNEPRTAAEIPAKAESIPLPPRITPPETKPARAEAKPSQPKAMYDSLEEEMASLLGRPPGKT